MSESSSSRRRGVWSHWIPLVVTVAVATAGIAAWALSQRNSSTDDEDEQAALAAQHESGLDYDNADYGDNPPYGASSIVMGNSGGEGKRQGGAGSISTGVDTGAPGERKGGASSGEAVKKWAPSVQEVLRRTPSPQQILSGAGKTVAAGVAGVAGAVGSALVGSSAKPAFDDHATWSEEADAKAKTKAADGARSGGKRKVVAVVVSADTKDTGYTDADGFHEHASILSHIPQNTDQSAVKLFILIYAPGLQDPSVDASANLPAASISSSFSNISHKEAQTPKEDTKPSLLVGATASTNSAFNAIQAQALALVDRETQVMPFTSPGGHVHMLRHLQPDIIYLQESLAGEDGAYVRSLQTWARHDIVLVVGAEDGSGGLADDSEVETPTGQKQAASSAEQLWWQKEERVGRGRGVVVVDGVRVHDDWLRRVQGRE